MPSLNLRLSREEHEALVARAALNGRSLQREIVWMLLRGLEEDGWVEGAAGVRPDLPSAAIGLGDKSAGGRPPFPSSDRPFRPDPKGGSR